MELQNKTTPNIYYWLASYPLEPGSVVLPGNWGRIIRKYNNQNHNYIIVAREYIYELVRREKFPELPSRLQCSFLCESEADVRRFQQETARTLDIIYEVELVGDRKSVYKFDWQLVNFPQLFTVEDLEKRAIEYWKNSESVQNPEVLTENPIKIIRSL